MFQIPTSRYACESKEKLHTVIKRPLTTTQARIRTHSFFIIKLKKCLQSCRLAQRYQANLPWSGRGAHGLLSGTVTSLPMENKLGE